MEICIKIDCAIEQNQQKDDLSKLPDVYEANAKIIEENLIHLTGTDFYGRYERKQFRFYQEATKLREENDFHANHDR